jgi:hypothetical protein
VDERFAGQVIRQRCILDRSLAKTYQDLACDAGDCATIRVPAPKREKPLAQTLSFSQRKVRLIGGSLTALFPPFVWWAWNFALGDDFIRKHAVLYYRLVEPEEIYLFLLVCGGLLELVALFILERSRQKPRDWISILAVIVGVCSIVLVVFFFAFSTGIIFGGS